MPKSSWALAVMLAALACGAPPEPPVLPPPTHTVVTGEPEPMPVPESDRLELGAPIQALGTTGTGTLVAVAGEQVYEVDGLLPHHRPLYASGGDPQSLGEVHAVSPRTAGGAWIASAHGLFQLEGLYVSFARLGAGGALRAVSDAPAGTLHGVWLGAEEGLYRWRSDAFERLTVAGRAGGAGAVAVDRSAAAVLAMVEGAPALLLPDGGRIVSGDVPGELGVRAPFAGAQGMLFAGSDHGLVRWVAGAEHAWTLLPGVPVHAIAVDPLSNVAWARTDDALVRLEDDARTRFPAPAVSAEGPALIAVDARGDVWINEGEALVRYKTGPGGLDATFGDDVLPWLEQHCTSCHADFRDLQVFDGRAELALDKVRSGDMPRCTGGVPCPQEERMSGDAWAVLEAWIRGGKKP